MTWGVNDVDLVVLPEAGGCSRGDGNSTLLLLFHPVHGGSTVVHLTDLVSDTCVIQDSLSGGCLTGVNVRHDADVTNLVQVGEHVLCHGCLRNFLLTRGMLLLPSKFLGSGSGAGLPAVVCECLVSLGHLVSVLTTLHCSTEAV